MDPTPHDGNHRPEVPPLSLTYGSTRTTTKLSSPGEAALPEASVPARSPDEVPSLPSMPGQDIWHRLRGAPAESRFTILKLLGLGSTSQVYAVADRNLLREVAVKVLDERVQDDSGIASFIEEAQLTAGLDHSNIPPVLDLDLTASGRPYFATRRLEGRTLGDLIDSCTKEARAPGIDTPNAIVSRMIAICNAMAYAHHRGVIHQDLKPDNILVGSFGELLVLDWGCAAHRGGPAQARHLRHAALREPGADARRARRPAQRHLLPRRHHVPPADRAAADVEPGQRGLLAAQMRGLDRSP